MPSTVLGPLCIPRWVRPSSCPQGVSSLVETNHELTDERAVGQVYAECSVGGSQERRPEDVVFGLSLHR